MSRPPVVHVYHSPKGMCCFPLAKPHRDFVKQCELEYLGAYIPDTRGAMVSERWEVWMKLEWVVTEPNGYNGRMWTHRNPEGWSLRIEDTSSEEGFYWRIDFGSYGEDFSGAISIERRGHAGTIESAKVEAEVAYARARRALKSMQDTQERSPSE